VRDIVDPNCAKLVGESDDDKLSFTLLNYTIGKQYTTMCNVWALEIQKLKLDLAGKPTYSFLMHIVSLIRNAKLLFKKIALNSIIKESFKSLTINLGLLTEESFT
jgi:hypothetical protein